MSGAEVTGNPRAARGYAVLPTVSCPDTCAPGTWEVRHHLWHANKRLQAQGLRLELSGGPQPNGPVMVHLLIEDQARSPRTIAQFPLPVAVEDLVVAAEWVTMRRASTRMAAPLAGAVWLAGLRRALGGKTQRSLGSGAANVL
jgi:hypothetical protein